MIRIIVLKIDPEVSGHTGRNCFNLFQISFSANTADTDPGVSGMSIDLEL